MDGLTMLDKLREDEWGKKYLFSYSRIPNGFDGPVMGRRGMRDDTDFYQSGVTFYKNLMAESPEGSEEQAKYKGFIEGLEKTIQNREKALSGTDDEFIDYYLKFYPWGPGNTAGTFIYPLRVAELAERIRESSDPRLEPIPEEAKNKNYVFLAVAGYNPEPQFSYPSLFILDEVKTSQTALLGQGSYVFDRESDFKKRVPSFLCVTNYLITNTLQRMEQIMLRMTH